MERVAYLSLGSNLGDRAANLATAVEHLRALGRVSRISSWYETEPVEVTEQPWFLNGVVELQTELTPVVLLSNLLQIERAMGRVRNQPKGPRSIDIDLLLYDDETVNTPELTVPHAAMHERRFVLVPLVEIAPEAVHPVLRKPAWKLLEMLSSSDEVRPLKQPE